MNQTNSNLSCEVVQDLLPLYQDNICSQTSRQLIEEHLKDCNDCNTMLAKLKNTFLDDKLTEEKTNILEAHYKQEKRRSFTIGVCVAGILMIPVIVCLICNLAIGHALDWFFIVLVSLLLVASLSVVPLLAPAKSAGLWTIGSFTGSLLLLLLVTCLYAHGNWFLIAAVPTFFGLSVFLMPYVVYNIPLTEPLSHHKGLLVMLWDTVWLFAVIIVCGFYADAAGYWSIALEITAFCCLLPWALFFVIRYLKVHPLTKGGICSIITGLFCTIINSVIQWIAHDTTVYTWSFKDVNFMDWQSNPAINANIYLLIFLVTLFTGIALICAGTARQKKRSR